MRKKAVSPVIATTLLVLIVLVLAAIIILFARGFVSEAVTKSIRGGPQQAIEQVCDEVSFDASLSGSEVSIVNRGDVAIYKIGAQKVGGPDVTINEYEVNLLSGETSSFTIDTTGADEINIIPILLGGTEGGELQQYSCPKRFWQVFVL